MSEIIINNVSKSFKDVKALQSISCEIKTGELFGFIGPDGAGKTTLFRILTTLLYPDEGEILVDGQNTVKDYKALRNHFGYMPGQFSLYQDLSIEENLNFFASIFGTTIEENYDLIKDIYVQIEPFKKRKAGKLSGGMKQKLALSCALIHKPKVLVLDEPTTGVDAVSRKEFWEMLKHLKAQNITIVVSTPYMDEASLCERVALMQKGKLLDINTPQGIVDKFDRPLYAVKHEKKYALHNALMKYEHTNSAFPFGEAFHYTDKRKTLNIPELKQFLDRQSLSDVEIKETKPDIEDSFMALMEGAENE